MNEEYQEKIEQFKEYLLKLSNQMTTDLKNILLDKIITYELKRNNSDIVIYLFEYGFELLDLTFYGLDKNLQQYTEHISLPTKFPDNNWTNITPEQIYIFENEKTMIRFKENCSEQEIDLYDKYFVKKYEVFEDWFITLWKEAIKNIELKKSAYFSIHDTDERIDLSTMKEIKYEEIRSKHK